MTLLSYDAVAQTHKASIRGTLTDNSRLALSNVDIAVIQTDTNERRTTTTREQGDFIITSLPPGPYRLEVQQSGYKKYIRLLTLGVNQEIRLDVSLEIG